MMKNTIIPTALVALALAAGACRTNTEATDVAAAVDVDAVSVAAADQLLYQYSQIPQAGKFPRALYTDYSIDGVAYHVEKTPAEFNPTVELRRHPSLDEYMTVRYGDYADWTSGFFPGSLWQAYELTGREDLLHAATDVTNQLLPVSYMTNTHDLGFMVGCSYGNAMRLAPNDSIAAVIVRTADNLAGRFDDKIGLIRSWDFGPWNYPVIIDNMMNLELLFTASRLTGDSRYREIALRHADKTMQCHFRPDNSCYHVVSYAPDGTVESRGTFQGKDDESAWARGQAWGLYGYTECYRETADSKYLDHARKIAALIMDRNQTADRVPLWDYDARSADDTPRDASAGAITASAMLALGTMVEGAEGREYIDYAKSILASLSSPAYLAEQGTNGGFVLMHSTGSLPHGSEIDTPLNYADYYFLEALNRLKKISATE